MRLSVLDQSVAIAGRPQSVSIRESIELAQFCEGLGYHRFWVAEHHNHDTITGTAPEVLMAAIAATTKRIRIGSAGVMLPHYSSLKVAEQFRVLDAIAPDRIDLGLGRAPGSDGRTAFALNPNAGQAAAQFPEQVRDLLAWVSGEPLPAGHPYGMIRAFPSSDTSPDMWMLGTSDYGAQVAAHFGIPYCFAHFITQGQGCAQALALYRQHYQPSERHPEPIATVCVWALVTDTVEEANHQYMPRARSRLARDRGVLQAIESPEFAAAQPYTAAEQARIDALREDAFVGTPDKVGEQLRNLAQQLGVDELVVLTWTHDLAVRKHSYELLAKEFSIASNAEEE
ncbi:MAG: MsnO8 family LLM class oxidoreductase [Alphaproteobacteria bacterium]|nr:MsnO8 family LLM class oxidoreductase [Alphaproteobacteria bacterium]